MMKKMVIWLGLALVLLILMAACGSNATPTPKSEALAVTAAEQSAIDSPRTGDLAPDFTLPDSNKNMVHLVDELQENEQVVLVFYSSYICKKCMQQLREIGHDRAKYEEHGAQVIAIAIQSDREAKISAIRSGAQFPILIDSVHAVAEAYGVYDLLPEDVGLSTPSVFVINQDRQIVWKHIASSIFEEGEEISHRSCGGERVPSRTILENLL